MAGPVGSGAILFEGSYYNTRDQIWQSFGGSNAPLTSPNLLVSSITVDASLPTGFIKFRPGINPSTMSTIYGSLIFTGNDEPTTTYMDLNVSRFNSTIGISPTFSTNMLSLTFSRELEKSYTDIAVRGIQLFGEQLIDPSQNEGALGYLVGDITSGEVFLYANSFDTPLINTSTFTSRIGTVSSFTASTINTGNISTGSISTNTAYISSLTLDGSLSIPNLSTGSVTAGSISTGSISTNTIAFSTIFGDKAYISSLSTNAVSTNTLFGSNATIQSTLTVFGKIITNDLESGNIEVTSLQGSFISGDFGNFTTGSISTLRTSTITASDISTSTFYSPLGYISSLTTDNVIARGNIAASTISTGTLTANNLLVTTVVSSFVSTISTTVINADRVNANILSTNQFSIGNASINTLSTVNILSQSANLSTISSFSIANSGNISTNTLYASTLSTNQFSANIGNFSTLFANNISTNTMWVSNNLTAISTSIDNLFVNRIANITDILAGNISTGNLVVSQNIAVNQPLGDVQAPLGIFSTIRASTMTVSSIKTNNISTGSFLASTINTNAVNTASLNTSTLNATSMTTTSLGAGTINATTSVTSPQGIFTTLNTQNALLTNIVATSILTGPLTAGAISSVSVESGQGNYTAANVGTANISTLVVSTVQGNLRTTGNVYTSSINAPTGYVSTLGVSTIIGDYGNFSTLYVSTLFAPITTTGISTNTVSTNQLYATNGIISTLTVQGDTNISSIQGYNANYNNLSTVTGYIQTASVSTLTAPRVLGSVTFQNDVTVNGNLNISTALTAPSYNAVSTITSPTYLFGARNGGQIPFAITTNSTINSDASFYSASGMGFYPNTPNPSALIQGATPLMYLNNQIVNIPYNLSTNHFSTNTIDAMTGTFSTLNVSTITTANISTNNIQASGFVNCSTISTGSIVSNLVTAPSISTVQISSVSVTSLQAVIGNNLLVQSTINTPYIGGVLGNPMTLTSPVKGGTISANIGNFSTINVSTLNAPDIVSVSSLFTLEADISLAVISTLQFQPQFAPNIDLNLGAVVGGLVGGLSANAFNTLLGATALGTGIAGLTLPRTSGGVAPQNFQTVNGSTQLQVSTLTTPISTIFLTTDSTDPLHTPGNQISTVTTTTFGPGLFIRSISDPLNLADASSASTIQSFGQWVPVITPTTNIQANNINAVSANFTSSITAQTTITANGGLESVSTVVFTGASGTTFITAPTVTSQFKGPVSISTLNVSTVNGSSYPPPDQTIPIGCMLPFAGGSFTSVSVPSGYLLCNGNRILQSAYSALFAVIGYTYGPNLSDGYYSLPDTRGKVLAGTVDNNYSVEVSGLSVTLNGIVNGAFQVNTYNTPGQIFVGATISTINTPGSSTVYIIAIIHGNGSSTDPGSVTYLQLSTPVSFPSGNYYIVPNNVLPPSFTNQAMNAPTIGAIADLNRYNTQIGQAYHLQYITEVANHTHNYNQGGQQANAGIGGLPVGVPTNGGPVTGENNGLYSTPSGSYNKAMPLLPYNFACYYIIKY